MRRLRIILLLLGVIGSGLLLTACKSENTDVKKIKDLEFTVVEDADVPEQLMQIINEKKKEPFKLSYSNADNLYIVVGYGEQPTGGYSISVDDLFLTSNAVYIDTNLIGPSETEKVVNAVTYPYVVVKTEFIDKSVVFK
ncbi:protease complex subunit PrcB family protein [Anaerocolumna sp. AGMB13025]|uniref:protease complex subunit PrcB family protein n=1 Tax=Anaerocolumna sp. AGMB13025 TaxID=3039116 RepID=UPI00241DD4FE|nr:protease complex subunit PrcB family protein [Anaerocolumna sp. AGMB13025]WFR57386.1 protease complex subunit PrcB family protein [Anaerocolumna sp. AGMB13025]